MNYDKNILDLHAKALREDTSDSVLHESYMNLLSASPLIDQFTTWLFAIIGGTTGLIISNIKSISEFVPVLVIKLTLSALLVSLLLCFLSKYTATIVKIFCREDKQSINRLKALIKKHEREEKQLQESARQQGVIINTSWKEEVDKHPIPAFPFFWKKRTFKDSFYSDPNNPYLEYDKHIKLTYRQIIYSFSALILYVFGIFLVVLGIP